MALPKDGMAVFVRLDFDRFGSDLCGGMDVRQRRKFQSLVHPLPCLIPGHLSTHRAHHVGSTRTAHQPYGRLTAEEFDLGCHSNFESLRALLLSAMGRC